MVAPDIPNETLRLCRALPKAELHAHLNGSVRPSTLSELATSKGLQANAHSALVAARTLSECFEIFNLIHTITTEAAIIRRLAREACEDFAADGCVYLELRTTPKHRPEAGLTKRQYVEAVLAGIEDFYDGIDAQDARSSHAAKRNGIHGGCCSSASCFDSKDEPSMKVNVLLSIDRREGRDAAMETVALAKEYSQGAVASSSVLDTSRSRDATDGLSGNGHAIHLSCNHSNMKKRATVVGIDLGGNPTVGKWEQWREALDDARDAGLKVTLHCAEVVDLEEARQMLSWHPDRLGHCCFLDDALTQTLVESGIPVEICLTSNTFTNEMHDLGDHHFAELFAAGE
jgi:adenosine deaminase